MKGSDENGLIQAASWGAASALFLIAVSAVEAAGCASPLTLDARGCPCARGYRCCDDVCVPESQTCSPEPTNVNPSGEGGSAGEGDGTGGGNAPDASGDGGAASHTWMTALLPLSVTYGGDVSVYDLDLELGGDGSAYVTLASSCCDPIRHLSPIVHEYVGRGWGWQVYGHTATPEDLRGRHRVVIAEDGGIYLLAEDGVFRFDGEWQQQAAPQMLLGGERMTLAQDGAGRLHTVVADSETLSAVRFDGEMWEPVGPPVARDASGVSPLIVAGDEVYFVQSYLDTGAVVRVLEGSTWQTIAELPGHGALWHAGAPDGALYVGLRPPDASPDILVRRWDDGIWSDVAAFSTHYLAMHAAADGALYVAYNDDDGILHLVRWFEGQLSPIVSAPPDLELRGSQHLQLRVAAHAGGLTAYLGYLQAARAVLWRYE